LIGGDVATVTEHPINPTEPTTSSRADLDVTIRVCPAIDWRNIPPEAADDSDIVDRCYHQVVTTMQLALDELTAQRRLPVIG
jgi:hypothetical protein